MSSQKKSMPEVRGGPEMHNLQQHGLHWEPSSDYETGVNPKIGADLEYIGNSQRNVRS